MILLFLFVGFYIHYTAAVKFYRPFYITVSNKESASITDLFEIYGVSYFGDTTNLNPKDGRFYNCDKCYFVKLGIRNNYFIKDTLIVKYFDADEVLIEYVINGKDSSLFNTNCKACGLLDKISLVSFIKKITLILVLICIFLIILLIQSKKILLYIKRKRIESHVLYIRILLFILIGFAIVLLYIFLIVNKLVPETKNFNNSIVVEHRLESVYDEYVITIEDTARVGLEFVFSLNGNFWFSADSLLASVRNMDVDKVFEQDKEIVQAWKFVSNNTYHRMPETKFINNRIFDKPSILLNSLGYGSCSNRAQALCTIWENMGYKTRIWNVKNLHSFPEVFNGNKWAMLDPDYGLLLLTEEGQIASLNDIQFDTLLVPVMSGGDDFICNTENMIDTFPIRLKNVYQNDTLSSYYMLPDKEIDDMFFKLPVGAKLIFPIYIDSLASYVLKVFIPGFFDGEVNIPLLINSVVNNENMLTDSLSRCGVLYDSFTICGENIVISALINPLLFIPKKNKQISLSYYTNNTWYPEIKIFNKPAHYEVDLFKVISYLSESVTENKSQYLEKSKNYLRQLNLTIVGWEDVEKIIELHSYGKEYPMHKMDIIKRVFLSEMFTDERFLYWINCPENIALILIFLDKWDNDNYFIIFEKYINISTQYSSNQ